VLFMPRKPVGITGWTREIIAVHIGENGIRTERDFDLYSDEEKEHARRKNTEIAMRAAGYEPVEKNEAVKNEDKYSARNVE